MPRISVITPAYNAAAQIGRTIASVQAQTYRDWEHIIIDDGSTDESRAVVDACREGRLSYRYQNNQGPGEARNHGIRISHGEYVIFLDAGDWWDARALERLVNALRDSGPAAIAHGDWAFADDAGNVSQVRSSAFARGEGLRTLVLYNPMAIHTVLAPRQLVMDAGSFTPSATTLEDWHLWLQMARGGCRFIHVPYCVAYYHWQPDSRSRNIERRKANRLEILDNFWELLVPDDPLRSLMAESYASALVEACVSWFGQGDVARALEEFDAAAGYDPLVVGRLDTYYRIAYAEQSAHEGGSAQLRESLDEPAARRRLDTVLAHVEARYPAAEARAARRAAHAALGMAGYHERRNDIARRYLWSAVRADPAALRDRPVRQTLVRTLVPVRLAEMRRQRKNSK